MEILLPEITGKRKDENEEPIGIAKRNIKKDEYIEILIDANSGQMFSEAIEFFNKQ